MRQIHALEAWLQRDQAFETEFALSESMNLRHVIGRLLGRHKPPSLNRYRDHLLTGHAIGALPTQHTVSSLASQESLAALDHDLRAITPQASGLQTQFARRAVSKLLMDLQAGKIPIIEREIDRQNNCT